MIIYPNYELIIVKLPNSRIGLERRCIFGNFQYNLLERFLSIDFKVEYGITHNEMIEGEAVERWETLNNPAAGITPYPDPFVANDSTIVDMQGRVVQKAGENAIVDLNNPNEMYIGQFGYFYNMAKGHPVIIEELIKSFIQNSIINGQFIDV